MATSKAKAREWWYAFQNRETGYIFFRTIRPSQGECCEQFYQMTSVNPDCYRMIKFRKPKTYPMRKEVKPKKKGGKR